MNLNVLGTKTKMKMYHFSKDENCNYTSILVLDNNNRTIIECLYSSKQYVIEEFETVTTT